MSLVVPNVASKRGVRLPMPSDDTPGCLHSDFPSGAMTTCNCVRSSDACCYDSFKSYPALLSTGSKVNQVARFCSSVSARSLSLIFVRNGKPCFNSIDLMIFSKALLDTANLYGEVSGPHKLGSLNRVVRLLRMMRIKLPGTLGRS